MIGGRSIFTGLGGPWQWTQTMTFDCNSLLTSPNDSLQLAFSFVPREEWHICCSSLRGNKASSTNLSVSPKNILTQFLFSLVLRNILSTTSANVCSFVDAEIRKGWSIYLSRSVLLETRRTNTMPSSYLSKMSISVRNVVSVQSSSALSGESKQDCKCCRILSTRFEVSYSQYLQYLIWWRIGIHPCSTRQIVQKWGFTVFPCSLAS